jgi:predicted nucleotidyltransferase
LKSLLGEKLNIIKSIYTINCSNSCLCDLMVLTIAEIKDRVIPIVQSHGVNSFSIFGSYARNEATDESDLDFIMDDGDVSTLVKYIALVNDLEKEFNCHVDLVSSCSNNKDFLNKISVDAVVLYER